MNPILKEAIKTLSVIVNTSTGMSHPLDESRTKELFKALQKQGIPLRSQDVYNLAIKCSWPQRHAKELAALAERIGNGGRVQIKHPRDWGEPTVKRIISELEET